MAATYAGGALLDKSSAEDQAEAEEQHSEAEASRLERQALIREFERENFLEDSADEMSEKGTEAGDIVSHQKAAMAAQGIDVDSNLGLKLEYDEREKNRRDVQIMKNNSVRQALGMEMEISDLRKSAKDTRRYGAAKSKATIASGNRKALMGGIRAIGSASKGSWGKDSGDEVGDWDDR